jgi:homoserine O-acetyltransferase
MGKRRDRADQRPGAGEAPRETRDRSGGQGASPPAAGLPGPAGGPSRGSAKTIGDVPMGAGDDTANAGIVATRYATVAEPPNELRLESGERLGPITIAYETYGTLSERRDNAILVLHALSGDAHVAGRHAPDDKRPGWWDMMIGPGKALDTDRYFVIGTNVIGGCSGSTGPSSTDPKTGRPYGTGFPIITVADMVEAQALLLDRLGIERLLAVVGGSMGGMQALEWAVAKPERVHQVIALATAARQPTQAIAFNEVGRQAIMADPDWNDGDYYGRGVPAKGLAVARMIGHITYLSDEAMHEKFGRRLQDIHDYSFTFSADFQVESYLRYQGLSFTERFDANTYLYITRALDYFDLTRDRRSLVDVFRDVTSRFLVMAFSSDWLHPPYQLKEIVGALRATHKHVSYYEVQSGFGHDAFLLEREKMEGVIGAFLASGARTYHFAPAAPRGTTPPVPAPSPED